MQPVASSSDRFEMFGSQSSDWFWLPPMTRSATIGSLTLCALPRLAVIPSFTTSLCVFGVALLWNESAQNVPGAPPS